MKCKKITELKKEELTIEQKLGMLVTGYVSIGEKNLEDILEMVRERKIGAVWAQPVYKKTGSYLDDAIERILELADYPIIIVCDCEEGPYDHRIPQQIAITAANGGADDAYSFGRLTGAVLRSMGINTICNPVVDIADNGNNPNGYVTRTFGADIDTVVEKSMAVSRGMRDAGVLSVAKHYPGGGGEHPWDSHMREGFCSKTAEELLATDIKPYIELARENLIDGIMVAHHLFPNIDPDRPSTLSAPCLDLLRKEGFNGFYLTDALSMMGVTMKYGERPPTPLCIQAGCDLALPWGLPARDALDALLEWYNKGLLTDERVNEAVDRVLAAQHKTLAYAESGDPEIRQEDIDRVNAIHERCISSVIADGVTESISKDGKHLFVIIYPRDTGKIDYTPGPRDWYIPSLIRDEILKRFPNSDTSFIPQFPDASHNVPLFDKQMRFDDVVFITNTEVEAYVGRECLNNRIVDLMDAMQANDRIVAHLHFGNPYVAADAPFVPRVILGYASKQCIAAALDVLAGDKKAVGIIPYSITFHKKGHIFY